MRITQGAFSFLPDLTDDEIRAQLNYCIDNEWAIAIEHTDDPHPRNVYWDMWGAPMYDLRDPAGPMGDLAECRAAHPQSYIRINAFDSTRAVESVVLSFIVNRPAVEKPIRMTRIEVNGRSIRYSHDAS